jgi:hypothetical protein
MFEVGSYNRFGWKIVFFRSHLEVHRQKAGYVPSHRSNVFWYRDMGHLGMWKYFLKWCFGSEKGI